jgi:hypothetical protein
MSMRRRWQRLKDSGLVLNLEKCQFGLSEANFLGHEVTANVIQPLTDHVEAVRVFPSPSNKQGLQQFLGTVNFYCRFLPGTATVLRPLTEALKGTWW